MLWAIQKNHRAHKLEEIVIEIWGLEELTDLHIWQHKTNRSTAKVKLWLPVHCVLPTVEISYLIIRELKRNKPIAPDLTDLFGIQYCLVQLLSRIQLFVTPWITACQASLSSTVSQNLLKLISIESMMPSNHLILCFPLLLLHSIFPCIRVFSSELAAHIRWSKYWSLSFSTSPSNENSGLISFRIDWFDLLAVQGTLKSLLQHHSS